MLLRDSRMEKLKNILIEMGFSNEIHFYSYKKDGGFFHKVEIPLEYFPEKFSDFKNYIAQNLYLMSIELDEAEDTYNIKYVTFTNDFKNLSTDYILTNNIRYYIDVFNNNKKSALNKDTINNRYFFNTNCVNADTNSFKSTLETILNKQFEEFNIVPTVANNSDLTAINVELEKLNEEVVNLNKRLLDVQRKRIKIITQKLKVNYDFA